MIECPQCGLGKSMVIDSRPHKKDRSLRRRRECMDCGHRFSTNEITLSRYEELETIDSRYQKLNELLEQVNSLYEDSRSNK